MVEAEASTKRDKKPLGDKGDDPNDGPNEGHPKPKAKAKANPKGKAKATAAKTKPSPPPPPPGPNPGARPSRETGLDAFPDGCLLDQKLSRPEDQIDRLPGRIAQSAKLCLAPKKNRNLTP